MSCADSSTHTKKVPKLTETDINRQKRIKKKADKNGHKRTEMHRNAQNQTETDIKGKIQRKTSMNIRGGLVMPKVWGLNKEEKHSGKKNSHNNMSALIRAI